MASDPAVIGPAEGRSPETVDRILVGVCGAIWLVLLAAGVIVTVALVRLGSGHAGDAEKQSSWLLYSIIVVSALIILGAIPLLLQAHRTALAGARSGEADALPPTSPAAEAVLRPVDSPPEKVRVFGVDPYSGGQRQTAAGEALIRTAVLDRLWLRGTVALLSATGLALIAVAVATYLLAESNDTAAWVALGVAGAFTAAMPVVLVMFGRRFSGAMNGAESAE